jgi:hypothetical protein
VPRPEPGPHQVLVAVRAAGINISEATIPTALVREVLGIRPEGQARRERTVEIDQPCAPCLPLLACRSLPAAPCLLLLACCSLPARRFLAASKNGQQN